MVDRSLIVDIKEQSFLVNEQDVVIENELDSGGQGIISQGTYMNNKIVIKTLMKNDYDVKEIEAYTKLLHPYMVKFHGYYMDKKENINLVLDYAEGEDLSKIIPLESLTYKQKLDIVEKLADFLIYLRENHAIHRDLKPQNIKVQVLNDDSVDLKVLDFGITKISKYTVDYTRNNIGTLAYAPPEIFTFDENTNINETVKISYKYDIWSLGMITSYLFSGIFPWKSNKSTLSNHLMFVEVQLIKKKDFIIPGNLDSNVKKLIAHCTNIDPDKRINPYTILNFIKTIKLGQDVTEINITEDNYK
jgi:serine/threonine protein kinase